jgi:hypothetical protein
MKLRLVIEIDLCDYADALENENKTLPQIESEFKENINEEKEEFLEQLNLWAYAKEISFKEEE